MAQGLPGSQFPGEDAVMRELRDVRRLLQQVMAANQLATAGIGAVPGGIIVEGSQVVNGPLTVNGNSAINGTMSINGPLILQPGSIENDSLTDPLVISTSGVSQNNFTLGTTAATFAVGTVDVPPGYSKASVLCMVVGGAMNDTGSIDYIYVASMINGSAGGESPQPADPDRYATTSANGIRSLTGLNGGTITLGCRMRTNGGTWPASISTFANMNAVVYFSR